jgi:hypothetical protein
MREQEEEVKVGWRSVGEGVSKKRGVEWEKVERKEKSSWGLEGGRGDEIRRGEKVSGWSYKE